MAKKISPDNFEFLRDCYTGGGGFADGSFLIQHPRESDDKFARRKEAAAYSNYPRKILDSWISHLFRRAPQRETGLDVYNDFVLDCDRRGTRLDQFLKRAARLSGLLGTVYLIVDKASEKAANRAEAAQKRLFPYLVTRTPDQVVTDSLKTDDSGAMVAIAFAEKDEEDSDRYRHFDLEGWKLTKDEGGDQVLESGAYDLGMIPVIPLHSTDPLEADQHLVTPWIWDVAVLAWSLFNRESELDEIFRAQTFSILTLPVRDLKDIEAYKSFDLSVENALPYNAEAAGQPDFIAPPDGPAKLYMERIEGLIRAIYALANLEFTSGVSGGTASSSGIAMSYRFQEANRTIAEWAARIEAAEARIARLVGAWEGKEFEGEISYPRDFDVVDLERELKTAIDALTLEMGQRFNAELKKRTVRTVLGEGLDPETLKAIDDEIDAGDVYDKQADRENGE